MRVNWRAVETRLVESGLAKDRNEAGLIRSGQKKLTIGDGRIIAFPDYCKGLGLDMSQVLAKAEHVNMLKPAETDSVLTDVARLVKKYGKERLLAVLKLA